MSSRPSSVNTADSIVVGAGFAGLSTALHLLRGGQDRVLVLEQDRRPGGRSSGRNAGMIRQALSDPVLCGLAVEGRRSLERWASVRRDLGWARTGSLLLASGADTRQLDRVRAALRRNSVTCHDWDASRASRVVPPLSQARFDSGLYCPSDARIEIHGLVRSLSAAVKERGGRVVLDAAVSSIDRRDGLYVVRTAGSGEYRAPVLVNAAGAWAERIAYLAGASRQPLVPYRRHLYECAYPSAGTAAWPFVWDLSSDFYFRPIAAGLLMSPCDKKPFKPGPGGRMPGGESTDRAVRARFCRKAAAFTPRFGRLRILREKAGLRTMTPDGRFLIGPDPVREGFYWAAGLGGHGVTTAFPVGRLAAGSVLGTARRSEIAPHLPSRYVKSKGRG